jgi:hypothetical protein
LGKEVSALAAAVLNTVVIENSYKEVIPEINR